MMELGQSKFLLRWRFEWSDRPPKYGMWSQAGSQDDLETKAWRSNKSNLLYAIIEAKDRISREIKPIVIVEGHRFMNFQWLAEAVIPMRLGGQLKKLIPWTKMRGIKVLTPAEEITVFDCGKVTRQPNSATNINFATFGK